tara:strand:+ start:333 stop:560 length:228 start_codon:yes stop_codon:yes gene_type:complete
MAKKPIMKTKAKKAATKKAPAQKSVAKKAAAITQPVVEREKNAFEKNFGEGTAFDLDYGKLLIIALCIYIAVKVS